MIHFRKNDMVKLGPLENIIGEEISGYKFIPADHVKKTNDRIFLKFKSGKKLLFGFMCVKKDSGICRPSYMLMPIE